MRYQYLFVALVSFALPAVALAAADTSSLGFVPLTSIPGIDSAGNAATLPDFLNNVYKLSIGLAAVLAVLQIIRAGIMYMGGDSITEKKEARSLITLAIGGLVLVLSPVIVFSIINPKILDLKIEGLDELADTNFGANSLKSAPAVELLWENSTLARSAAQTKCTADGGTLKYVCRAADGSTRSLAISQTCKGGEEGKSFCTRLVTDANKNDSAAQCKNFEGYTAAPSTASCSAAVDNDYIKTADACCSGITAGNQCCARPILNPTSPTTTADRNIVVTKYIYTPVSGSPSDAGPVPASKSAYDSYVAACAASSGKIENTYGKSQACSPSDIAASTDSRKSYFKCTPTTVTCYK